MSEEFKCDECEKVLSSEDGLRSHKRDKHPVKEKVPIVSKKTKRWMIGIVVLGVIVFGIYWLLSNTTSATSLPPTTMQGHTETVPVSHILKKPMSLSMQKHMLEHVDGIDGSQGGVVLNYDCVNFECEEGLVENLESFANKFDNVFVAPFKNMEVKIAITRLNRIETYDELDERKIEIFITGKIPE